MKMKEFIKENRKEIDNCINSVLYRYDGRGGRGTVHLSRHATMKSGGNGS
jgi:hypothetical protein